MLHCGTPWCQVPRYLVAYCGTQWYPVVPTCPVVPVVPTCTAVPRYPGVPNGTQVLSGTQWYLVVPSDTQVLWYPGTVLPRYCGTQVLCQMGASCKWGPRHMPVVARQYKTRQYKTMIITLLYQEKCNKSETELQNTT